MRGLIAGFLILLVSTGRAVGATERGAGVFADETLSALQSRLGLLRRSIVEIARALPDLPAGIGRVVHTLHESGDAPSLLILAVMIAAIFLAAFAAVRAICLLIAFSTITQYSTPSHRSLVL